MSLRWHTNKRVAEGLVYWERACGGERAANLITSPHDPIHPASAHQMAVDSYCCDEDDAAVGVEDELDGRERTAAPAPGAGRWQSAAAGRSGRRGGKGTRGGEQGQRTSRPGDSAPLLLDFSRTPEPSNAPLALLTRLIILLTMPLSAARPCARLASVPTPCEDEAKAGSTSAAAAARVESARVARIVAVCVSGSVWSSRLGRKNGTEGRMARAGQRGGRDSESECVGLSKRGSSSRRGWASVRRRREK